MNSTDCFNEIKRIAHSLIADENNEGFSINPIYGGGNNRSYLMTSDKNRYFLKHYFKDQNDPRDRVRADYEFSSFAWSKGVRCIARPIAFSLDNSIGIYEYIHGRKLEEHEIDEKYVTKSLEFILTLNKNKTHQDAKGISVASEACFSIAEHLRRVNVRMLKLKEIIVNDDIDAGASEFVNKELLLEWLKIKDFLYSTGELIYQDINPRDRLLSPSDFGFHNALLTENNEIKFFDFEYAGWDDPAKLVCDFFSQPAVPIAMKYFNEFSSAIANLTSDPEETKKRIEKLLPLIRIKWCCIILNCFVTPFKARKEYALPLTSEHRAVQISKARKILDTVKNSL